MRRAIGTTWVFQITLVFILIFAAFLSIYINFSKAFKMKNEVINMIERKEGITDNHSGATAGSIQLIAGYLASHAYSGTGKCPDGDAWYGATTLDGNGISDLESASSGRRYYYCVRKVIGFDEKNFNKAYYEVRVFFRFDLPIFGDIQSFPVDGETIDINFPADDLDYAVDG